MMMQVKVDVKNALSDIEYAIKAHGFHDEWEDCRSPVGIKVRTVIRKYLRSALINEVVGNGRSMEC
jgi:hypothetical protein